MDDESLLAMVTGGDGVVGDKLAESAIDFRSQRIEMSNYIEQSRVFKRLSRDLSSDVNLCRTIIGQMTERKVNMDGLLAAYCGILCCTLIALKAATIAQSEHGDDEHCIELLILAGERHAAANELIPFLSSHITDDACMFSLTSVYTLPGCIALHCI